MTSIEDWSLSTLSSQISAANPVTTAIWELEIFGGRPSWKATGLQLQSGNS